MSKAPPHFDAPWEIADAGAIQALARGDASPEMQAIGHHRSAGLAGQLNIKTKSVRD